MPCYCLNTIYSSTNKTLWAIEYILISREGFCKISVACECKLHYCSYKWEIKEVQQQFWEYYQANENGMLYACRWFDCGLLQDEKVHMFKNVLAS